MEFKINQLDRDVATGGITTAHWTATKTTGEHTASVYGAQALQPDASASNFVDYADVTEAQVVNWVKSAMGTEAITAMEAALDAQIALAQAPVTASGVPWVTVL